MSKARRRRSSPVGAPPAGRGLRPLDPPPHRRARPGLGHRVRWRMGLPRRRQRDARRKRSPDDLRSRHPPRPPLAGPFLPVDRAARPDSTALAASASGGRPGPRGRARSGPGSSPVSASSAIFRPPCRRWVRRSSYVRRRVRYRPSSPNSASRVVSHRGMAWTTSSVSGESIMTSSGRPELTARARSTSSSLHLVS